MEEKPAILCCDSTDHGGRVLEGYATMSHDGHRVAGKGHRVFCPQCNGIFPIVESTQSFLGYAPALDGMRTACGARLIASQTTLKMRDDSPGASKDTTKATPKATLSATSTPTTPAAATAAAGTTSAAPSAPPADAVHLVFRIGLFNDGTGNNITNSRAALEKCSPQAADLDKHPGIIDQLMAACRKQDGVDGSSYAGGETNVHRLYDLYQVTKDIGTAELGKDGRRYVYHHAYIEGIGTRAEQKDSLYAYGLGWGPTGVIARAIEAVDATVAQIKQFHTLNPNIIVDAVELDLFGFSRGAASARHVSWLILHAGDNGVMARKLRDKGLPLKPGWSGDNKSDLCIRFMGIYETVAAVGIPDNGNNDPVKLYLADDCADRVVHLVAADECPENFALNHVAPGKHTEVALPGVHSDLGGSYAMQEWEQAILTKPQVSMAPLDYEQYQANASFTERSGRPKFLDDHLRGIAEKSAAWTRTASERHDAAPKLDATWLIDPQLNPPPSWDALKIQVWWKVLPNRNQRQYMQGNPVVLQVIAALVELRQVRGEYQLVTLRIMHAMAQQAGVPFKVIPPDPALALPADLLLIYTKLLAHAQGGGKGDLPLTREEQQWLSRRYLHQSANWNPIVWKPIYEGLPNGAARATLPTAQGADLNLFYFNRPADKRKRLTFNQKKGH